MSDDCTVSDELRSLAGDISKLHSEAVWNAKYLALLRQPFTVISDGSLREVRAGRCSHWGVVAAHHTRTRPPLLLL